MLTIFTPTVEAFTKNLDPLSRSYANSEEGLKASKERREAKQAAEDADALKRVESYGEKCLDPKVTGQWCKLVKNNTYGSRPHNDLAREYLKKLEAITN